MLSSLRPGWDNPKADRPAISLPELPFDAERVGNSYQGGHETLDVGLGVRGRAGDA
jgi:hypothetical protein